MTPVSPYALERIVAPRVEPISLEELKAYLKIDHQDEDSILQGLIVAAREMAEQYLRLSLAPQTLKLTVQHVTETDIYLPQGPVQSIVSVTAVARNGDTDVVSASTYELHVNRQVLGFDVLPSAHRLEVLYVAGFASASMCPRPIKYGMLAHISALYDGRGDAELAIPRQSLALYAPYKEVRL